MKKCAVLMDGLKPTFLMILVQASFAGVNVLVKLAVNHGTSLEVLIAYRFIFATAFILPIALTFERKRPKMTPMVVFQGFLCGLFGGTFTQLLYMGCLVETSATFAAAIGNLVPAATYILAVIFRMEKLGLRTPSGKLKIFGTALGIIGAMVLTFYKKMEFDIWKTHIDLMKILGNGDSPNQHHSTNHVLGAILGISSCVTLSLWLIVQSKMGEKYPYQYSSTALISFMAAVQTTVYALCTVRDWSQWQLKLDIGLFTIVYSGALVSGGMISVIAWCVRMRGPLFVSVFSPLMLVLVALASSLLLEELLNAGSVIGSVLIVAGLYVVLWGKRIEIKKQNQLLPTAPKISTSEGAKYREEPKQIIDIVIDPSSEQFHYTKTNSDESKQTGNCNIDHNIARSDNETGSN